MAKEVKYIIIGFLTTLIALSGLYILLNEYLYKDVTLADGTNVSLGRTPDIIDTIIFFFLIALCLIGFILFIISLIKVIRKNTFQ
ncbi:hypothetical protein [Aquimarina mytili]|uniref:Uncharacterized protein n=1 Tax=Aquimarina mytili TaxID=874423 RepID=A0A936ZR54_9FLAO|nr:hypothetical protein [Aquimarina mytili]MBL0684119.1 hypothetical protein [Aquimarina mytili]